MADLAPLSERIGAALTGATTSAAVSALISEASAAATLLQDRLREAERISLDPLAADDAVEAATAEVVRLGLAIRRQQSALQQLDARLTKVTVEEKRAAERAEKAAAVKLRDEAATALREKYPQLAGELVTLMRQVVDAEAACQAAQVWPNVEMVVRGVAPNGAHERIAGTHGTLARLLYLPAFDVSEQSAQRPLWNGRAMG